MPATCCAVSAGFAAQTSAAAPATSGVENDVPLDQPYRPGGRAGQRVPRPLLAEEPAAIAPKTLSPGAASEICVPVFEK